jgi:hypothetical protein
MRSRLIGIRKDRQKATGKLRAEVHGGIKSKSHDARHVPVSPPNSNTLIMAFGWFAPGLVDIGRNEVSRQAGLDSVLKIGRQDLVHLTPTSMR